MGRISKRRVIASKLFTPSEVGDIFGASVDSIRRLVRSGKLKSMKIPPGQHYKVAPAEILRYAKEHNISLLQSNRELLEELSLELREVDVGLELNIGSDSSNSNEVSA